MLVFLGCLSGFFVTVGFAIFLGKSLRGDAAQEAASDAAQYEWVRSLGEDK